MKETSNRHSFKTKYLISCLVLFAFFLIIYRSYINPGIVKEDEHLFHIFLGFDDRSHVGYHVCVESILEKSTIPVAVTPLDLRTLKGVYTRPKSADQLTDFTFTRFLVPFLSGYKGWSLFIDGNDMLIREDISKLFALRDDRYAVMVVKHPEFKTGTHSFMDKSISTYRMFNWSSVMLFNNAKCRALTPKLIHEAERLYLHQFKWLESEELIGELPSTWNHLVGYYEPRSNINIVHWTSGAPFQGGDFAKTEYADEWFAMEMKATQHLSKAGQ